MATPAVCVNATTRLCAVLLVAPIWLLWAGQPDAAQTAGNVGYRDFSYGTTVTPKPSGEKAQSKLWWNDGVWWGCLFNPATSRYHIYWLDHATHAWTDTGVAVDDRVNSKSDALWDESTGKLYIASNYFSSFPSASTSASRWGRLYRYSYLPAQGTYVLDSGFPVTITKGSAEVLTIAKDSSDRLWVTWVQNQSVKVNVSGATDLDWNAEMNLPVGPAGSVTSDDISAVVAFGGQIGVMWSNQGTGMTYFSVHRDDDAPDVWQPVEAVLPGCAGACSDDHINLKADAFGWVFAVTKTSFTGLADPLIVLSVRNNLGVWSNHTVSSVEHRQTRPIVMVAEDDDRLFVFATSPEAGGSIYVKESALSHIAFTPGQGSLFIDSVADVAINNVTSTKSSVTQTTGIVALATDPDTRWYSHNELSLSRVAVTSFAPSSGVVGAQVTLYGYGLAGATAVHFNQSPATFTVITDEEIRATVPAGATTGPISVTAAVGSARTATNFSVLAVPTIQSFSPTSGAAATSVLLTGSGFSGATAVAFNGAAASFTVSSDTSISTIVPTNAVSGRITVTSAAGTGTSETEFVVVGAGVTSIKALTFETGRLVDPTTGADRVNGAVVVETVSPLQGAYSARIAGSSDSYLEERFSPVDDFTVSLYIRVDALPDADVRIVQISNSGTSVGGVLLRKTGALRLRSGSTTIGVDSVALRVGQVYRILLRQRRGAGNDGVLEAYVAPGTQPFASPWATLWTGTWKTAADRVRIGATVAVRLSATFDTVELSALQALSTEELRPR